MASNNESLEVIENDYWGIPDFDSHIVIECHRLRKVPVSDLKPEDIRLLVSQNIGLAILIPLSLDLLSESPLLEVEHFRGDLLRSVCNIYRTYWNEHEEQYERYRTLANKAIREMRSSEYIDQADHTFSQELERSL